MEKLYTLKEAAKATGYNEQHLRKKCRNYEVAHTRRGERYFFNATDLDRLVVHTDIRDNGKKGGK